MARSVFGGGASDFTFGTVEATGHALMKTLPTYTVTFWSAKTGGTQYTDLLLGADGSGGAASSVVTDSRGLLPEFQGPDTVLVMWADAGTTRTKVTPADAFVAMVAAPTGVAATDTAALQAAFDAVTTTGGRVMLRQGTYVLNSTLTLSKPTILQGAGKGDFTQAGGTVLSVASGTAYGLTVAAHGCTVSDLAVINTSGTAPTAGAGIRITSGDAVAISRVKVSGFWNGLQIEQGRHYTITDSHFTDSVNYGAYLRNTAGGQGDFGDCTFHGCFFNAYTTSRVAAAAIRWESGGGLKIVGCKTNGNMDTLGQSQTIGVDVAVADGISTSVFVVTGSSFEGIASGGAPIVVKQSGTGTGNFSKVVITGNEFLAGAGIRIVGTATGHLENILIANNLFSSNNPGVYLTNCKSVTVGRNRHMDLTSAQVCVAVAAGVTGYTVEPQDVDQDATNVAYIQDDAISTTTHDLTGSTGHYSREIPSTTSSVTYTDLFSVQFNSYAGANIAVVLTGQIGSLGGFTYKAERAVVQAALATVPTLTTIGTDVATANAPTVAFDVSANQTVKVKIRLPGSGTDVFGRATIYVDGNVTRVWKL